MNKYLLSIIGIVLLSSIISIIMPNGKTVKLIKGMTKLCCLAVILVPVLSFFSGIGQGKINFSVFSSQSVIETDVAFIDYCSNRRIESAESELEKKLQEVFSEEVQVSLIWEYRGDCDEEEAEGWTDRYLSVYRDMEIRITKVLLKTEKHIGEEVKNNMAEHIVKEYGCEVEFIE